MKLESAGEAIRELREEAGLSIGVLAGRMGCDKGLLSRYENGQVSVSSAVIAEVAAALGCSPLLVCLHCVRHEHPTLSHGKSKAALQFDRLLKEVEKPRKRRGFA